MCVCVLCNTYVYPVNYVFFKYVRIFSLVWAYVFMGILLCVFKPFTGLYIHIPAFSDGWVIICKYNLMTYHIV